MGYSLNDLQRIAKWSDDIAASLVKDYKLKLLPRACYSPGRYFTAVLNELEGLHRNGLLNGRARVHSAGPTNGNTFTPPNINDLHY